MSEVAYYGMFTDAGNAAVDAIVQGAISNDLTWSEVVDCLSTLSGNEKFAECMDTMVREIVYDAIFGSENDGQPDEAQEWESFDPDC
jgi:hypothetical protein